jgi:hypothetical protein
LKSNITATKLKQETRKRQNTKVKGSIVSNPILMIGKEVPHKAPAKIVKNTALALLLNFGMGNRLSPAQL